MANLSRNGRSDLSELTDTLASKLTNDGQDKNLEVGYGPICAKRFGWPWGVA